MRIITAAEVESALDYPELVERLRRQFRRGCTAPVRHHHGVDVPGEDQATLLLMPAWTDGGYIGVKIITVFPGNADRNKPAVMGAYMLMSGKTGEPLAMIDGPMLTVRRTAAASALASSYLSRPDSQRLLIVGTGALAPQLALAHASVRPIKNTLIWGRNYQKAKRLAKALDSRQQTVEATEDLEGAVRGADIVSCATLSTDPLIRGSWLHQGVHVDLVGAFRPDMRESDDDAIKRARVFVDTFDGATVEGGDIVQPLSSGILSREDIAADLFDLTRGSKAGRRYYDQITLFKSVGTALEDLAAAQLAVERR